MHSIFPVALAASLFCCASSGAIRPPDPAQSDGDKYQVILENERVRVLRYHDEPGGRTHLHYHPEFLLYALASFRRELIFPDGTKRVKEFEKGDVAWMPAQSHVGANIGVTPTEALLIEMKGR